MGMTRTSPGGRPERCFGGVRAPLASPNRAIGRGGGSTVPCGIIATPFRPTLVAGPTSTSGERVETSIDAPAAWVNPRDPARAVGPDGRPRRSRRAPAYADVADADWDDWRWQLKNRVNDLDSLSAILALTDEEREGLSAPDKFRVDVTPYFISLVDPDDPEDAIRRQIIPLGREQEAFTAMMEDSLAEDRHSPVPGLVHRYPDRVLMLVTTQ